MEFKKIRKDDEKGVSPVIAVILMVAITVVLAGVLWAMLQFPPPGDNQIRITTKSPEEKTFGWKIEIASISEKLQIEEAKFQIIDNQGTLLYSLTISNANPQPFNRGLSKVYPMTMSGPVRDNSTGDVINSDSTFDNYEDCYIAYIDQTNDERVSASDSFYIYKDYNNDKIIQ
jgi:flagellin-like protein